MSGDAAVWQLPPAGLAFPSGRFDVWRVPADLPGDRPEDRGALAPDELARAARFHFERDRKRYIRGRAALRVLLGRYLGSPPAAIRFQYQNHGKPEIAYPADSGGLSFNLSNSGELVLIAAGAGRAVGMDVEKLRPLPDLLNIARRFFSPGEVRDILALSEDKRNEAFFAVWTRKEAFLKATGVGLAFPLAEFSVSVDPDAAAKLVEIRGDEGIARGWFLTDVFPGQGYRAALASPGDPCRVDHWIFEPATHSRCI